MRGGICITCLRFNISLKYFFQLVKYYRIITKLVMSKNRARAIGHPLSRKYSVKDFFKKYLLIFINY